MRNLVMGLALAVVLAVGNAAQAAFMSGDVKVDTSGGVITVNWAHNNTGAGYEYFYSLSGPVPNKTLKLEIFSSAFVGPMRIVDKVIDVDSNSIIAGSTQDKNTAVSTPGGIALEGFLVGTRPTEILMASSNLGPVYGTGSLTLGGASYGFRVPVAAVPVPAGLALILGGLPFVGALRRRISRS